MCRLFGADCSVDTWFRIPICGKVRKFKTEVENNIIFNNLNEIHRFEEKHDERRDTSQSSIQTPVVPTFAFEKGERKESQNE